jgi:hypothetical protein
MVWLWDQKLANVENYYVPTDEDPEELESQEDLVKGDNRNAIASLADRRSIKIESVTEQV